MTFITCRLTGRTGNNLFQIMATIAHAKRNNCDYKIPSFVKSKYTKKNPFDLFPELTPEDERKIEVEHNQDGWTYEPLPFDGRNMRLTGYYQNYNYFNEYRKDLIDLFNLPKEKIDAICVHVRRGDYRRYPTKWPMMPAKYYFDACDVARDYGRIPVHVFSDEDVRNEYDGAMEYFIGGDPLEDWLRMTQYKYFIIANSTYSWTAAYLSGSDNVIAPHHTQWYGKDNSHLFTGELILPEWTQIKF